VVDVNTHQADPAAAVPSPRRRRLAAGALLLASAAILGWFVLRPPAVPSEAEGQAWLTGFVDLLTSSRLLGAKGPTAIALFPGLEPEAAPDCLTTLSRSDPSAPIVVRQRLELGRLAGDACDQAQFGMLSMTLRQSEGVTPGALVQRFTEAFGPPAINRDTGLDGSISYMWLVLDGVFVCLEEPAGPRAVGTFSVLFTRFYASPTTLPTLAEGVEWMDRIVDLLTGPALAHARGQAAVGMVDASMEATPFDDGCRTYFMTNLLTKGSIGSGQTLSLDHEEGQRCDEAGFVSLSMMVWRNASVTAEALVSRFSDKLGSPVVTRAFDRDEIAYQWRTQHGTTVDLVEGLAGDWRHWLRLRMSKLDK
jgi:hypothetical protein